MPRMYHWVLPSKQFLCRGTLGGQQHASHEPYQQVSPHSMKRSHFCLDSPIWYGFWVLHQNFGQWLQWLLESIVRIDQHHELHDSSLSLNLQLATSVLPTRKPRVSKTSWTHFRIQNLSGNYLVWTSRNGFKHSSWTCRQIFPNNQRHFSWGDVPLAAGRIKNASTFGMNFALVEAPVTVWNPRNPGEKKFTGKNATNEKEPKTNLIFMAHFDFLQEAL